MVELSTESLLQPLLNLPNLPFYVKLILVPRIVLHVFGLYLDFRQHLVYSEKKPVPTHLKNHLSDEKLELARLYAHEKSFFAFFLGIPNFINEIVFMLYFNSEFWHKSIELAELYFGQSQSLVGASIFYAVLSALFSLPLDIFNSVFSTFYIEAKHGFNRQTPAFFIKDQLKKLALGLVFAALLNAILVKTIEYTWPNFILYTMLALVALTVGIMFLLPNYILPLFDKFIDLPESDLKRKIYEMASKLNFPVKDIKVQLSSNRSSHSNAYFIGLCSKRIVFFDTLLHKQFGYGDESKEDEKDSSQIAETGAKDANTDAENSSKKTVKVDYEEEEILAILHHEIGHWHHWHIVKTLLLGLAIYTAAFHATEFCIHDPQLYTDLNLPPNYVIGILFCISGLFSPGWELIQFLMMIFSRHNEYQADRFAAKHGQAKMMINGLRKLVVQNKSYPYNDSLYSMFHHSHPTVLDREKALEIYLPASN